MVAAQGRPFAELIDDWLTIEKLGFDNAWLIDHFAPPFRPDGWLESWTTLAALAARTHRIRLGIAVTNAAVRNAGVLCKQAITLDQISRGRFEMAIGAGYYEEEQRMLGIDYPDARGRAERLREAVQVLDTGLRGEPVSLAGTYWHLEQLPMSPGPVQQPRPPIWVAAQGGYSLHTAALHADALVTMGDVGDQPPTTLSKLRQRFDRFAEACREVGRDRKTMRRAYLVGWADDRPFESDQALTEFVHVFAEVGVTDFMFGLSAARARLEQWAATLESLRAVASA
jgi:alkanesulfonate monooxygenase SsuD/methylene tetrahydromethanopterin reductase-like flavin-dependent oxidoreductase (luciferase family)